MNHNFFLCVALKMTYAQYYTIYSSKQWNEYRNFFLKFFDPKSELSNFTIFFCQLLGGAWVYWTTSTRKWNKFDKGLKIPNPGVTSCTNFITILKFLRISNQVRENFEKVCAKFGTIFGKIQANNEENLTENFRKYWKMLKKSGQFEKFEQN